MNNSKTGYTVNAAISHSEMQRKCQLLTVCKIAAFVCVAAFWCSSWHVCTWERFDTSYTYRCVCLRVCVSLRVIVLFFFCSVCYGLYSDLSGVNQWMNSVWRGWSGYWGESRWLSVKTWFLFIFLNPLPSCMTWCLTYYCQPETWT